MSESTPPVTKKSIFSELRECATNELSTHKPYLAHPDAFDLQDAMSSTLLVHPKMDSCEISVRDASLIAAADDNSHVHPRPPPTRLRDDAFNNLPWDDLTLSVTSTIMLHALARFQYLTGGASAAESTYTDLYCHKSVLEDMRHQLFEDATVEVQTKAMVMESSSRLAQKTLFLSTLLLVRLTEVYRGIVLNADIYEDEDFVASSSAGSPYITVCEDISVAEVDKLYKSSLDALQGDDGAVIRSILVFQREFLVLCQILAKLDRQKLRKKVQRVSAMTLKAVEALQALVPHLGDDDQEADLLKAVFNPQVNRPLQGTTPVRQIKIRSPREAIPLLIPVVRQVEQLTCSLLLQGDSLARIARICDKYSYLNDASILSRSLSVLNLYFDEDLIFGQYPLLDLIVQDCQHLMDFPKDLMATEGAKKLFERMKKPLYDTLKLRLLSPNRQRTYIEAVLLPDWSVLQQEANMVDCYYIKDTSGIPSNASPNLTLTEWTTLIIVRLMNRFVASSISLGLTYGHEELSCALWYRDFILSTLLQNISRVKTTKPEPSVRSLSKGKGKKGRKASTKTPPTRKSPQDLESDFDLVDISVRRMLCRGLFRFLAALRKAGILESASSYEFTSPERVFDRRYDVFQMIQHPAPVKYVDYVKASDFSSIAFPALLQSTQECFQTAKTLLEQLMGLSLVSVTHASMDEDEIRSLIKVCVGNMIYLRKLEQLAAQADDGKTPKVSLDFSAHSEFCMIKLD